ncbi:hypothetical protein J1614_009656 [Plenodomus biglobosus]|nr:hypothetical protein J1614_009656 [Plenodomus biglobosus]
MSHFETPKPDRNWDLLLKLADFKAAHRRKEFRASCTIGKTELSLMRAYHPCLEMFAVSCQIFQEASSVFYGQNTFAFTGWDSVGTPNMYYPRNSFIIHGTSWFSSIGSQATKLKRILLESDTLHTDKIDPAWISENAIRSHVLKRCFELLPLLRVLWQQESYLDVTIVPAGELTFERHSSNYPSCNRLNNTQKAEDLTEVVKYLQRDDLGLKRHLLAICHIAVHMDGREGTVLFRSTHQPPSLMNRSPTGPKIRYHPCIDHRLDFNLVHGRGLERTRQGPLNLLDLPSQIQKRIFDTIILFPETIVIDLSSPTPTLPGLLFTNRALYTAEIKRYFIVNHFSLRMAFDTAASATANLDAIDRWFPPCEDPRTLSENAARLRGRNVRDLRVTFIAPYGMPCRLEDLRINVTSLVRHATHLGDCRRPGQLKLHVALLQRTLDGGEEVVGKSAFPVLRIQTHARDSCRRPHRFDGGGGVEEQLGAVVNGFGALISARAGGRGTC